VRLPRSVVALLLTGSGVACGCAGSSGGGTGTPPAPAPATVVAPPVERTSDRGERTLPVAPIGRIAPEVPPEASPGTR
jgi:hypothetical protein